MCPKIIIVQKVIQTQTIAQIINVSMTNNNNNDDRLTAFDPGQPG